MVFGSGAYGDTFYLRKADNGIISSWCKYLNTTEVTNYTTLQSLADALKPYLTS